MAIRAAAVCGMVAGELVARRDVLPLVEWHLLEFERPCFHGQAGSSYAGQRTHRNWSNRMDRPPILMAETEPHMTPLVKVVPKPLPHPMAARAARLWPDSEYNRNEWLRAVRLVRSTSKGWVADAR
jgi:hypothetical protein